MLVLGLICLIIAAVFTIVWLYRKISIAKRYSKTSGEIIDLKNVVPLVNKTQIDVAGKYVYTECHYQGDVYVTVRFICKDGRELTRRYTSSEPLIKKINEHERSVPQYTAISPDWRVGKRVKVFYNPEDTLDVFVGKTPPITKKKIV